MVKNGSFSGSLAAAVSLLSFPVLAQAQMGSASAPATVLRAVEAIAAQGEVEWVLYPDLDADGIGEAVVRMTTPQQDGMPGFREWRVIAAVEGQAAEVGRWYGNDVEIRQVNASDGTPISVIASDGSFWSLRGNVLRPFGDLVNQNEDRITEGRLIERDLFASFGHLNVDSDYMARVPIDILPEAGGPAADEVLISLVGEGFWRDWDGVTPYILMTSDGQTIHSGWSFMHPMVFPLPDGGFQIIEYVDFSYRGIYFPMTAADAEVSR